MVFQSPSPSIIQSFDTVQSELLTGSLNKLHIQWTNKALRSLVFHQNETKLLNVTELR